MEKKEQELCTYKVTVGTGYLAHYDLCAAPVKYKISFLDIRGNVKTNYVCGRHFQSHKKGHERMLKSGYDSKFEYELLKQKKETSK